MTDKNSAIPAPAHKIIALLNQAGYEAYLVGGCVRDMILGKTPNDFDICTNALPAQTKACLAGYHLIDTGLKHGTITAMMNHEPYEITTYRVDGTYTDMRHPDSVTFVRSLKEDLARRDFTVNAMAYHPTEGIKDYFNGQKDLAEKVIRCVGDPDKRFQEDALRIMRALRFASTYGFAIEKQTADSLHKNKHLLKQIAVERINVELCKLLLGQGAGDIFKRYPEVLGEVLPEILPTIGFEQHNPHHTMDVWGHTVAAITAAPFDVTVRLTMLLHDLGKPCTYTLDEKSVGHFYGHPQKSYGLAQNILERLRFDSATSQAVLELIRYHDTELLPKARFVKKWLNKLGEDRVRQLILVHSADVYAQNPIFRQQRLHELTMFEEAMNKILLEGQCFTLRDLAVNGRDLMSAGVPAGKQVGETLNLLLNKVMNDELVNDKITLLNEAKALLHH